MLACAATASALAQTPAAASAQLTPAPARISDAAISRDQATYEAMQRRIEALNDAGRPVRDYALAKAQCWLDASFHEYSRNDRSAFPQAALSESERLVAAMETRSAAEVLALARDTPLVNGATRLRPDLWAAAAALKAGTGFTCAQHRTACAEVELVHAGNEFDQQQWRHAKPYVQIAEDLLGEAAALAARCAAPPAATAGIAPAPVPAPAAVAPSPTMRRTLLAAALVFAFDRSALADLRPASRAQLDALLDRLRAERPAVAAVRLVGHADRLHAGRDAAYNQRLSERRVAAVRAYLIARGIDASLITAEAHGDREPVENCRQGAMTTPALADCLLPNRRVDMTLETLGTP